MNLLRARSRAWYPFPVQTGEAHGRAAWRHVAQALALGLAGVLLGSAVIASVALFASFIETSANETLKSSVVDKLISGPRGVFDAIPINVADPKVFIGLLIGGAVPFLFSSLAIRAVGRTAGEPRHHLDRHPARGPPWRLRLRPTDQPDARPARRRGRPGRGRL